MAVVSVNRNVGCSLLQKTIYITACRPATTPLLRVMLPAYMSPSQKTPLPRLTCCSCTGSLCKARECPVPEGSVPHHLQDPGGNLEVFHVPELRYALGR